LINRDGKAVKRAGKSENLSERKGEIIVDRGSPADLEDKKGHPRID